MDKCMAEQKHLASEKAMEMLDPASVQEVLENDWLKNEAAAHRFVVKIDLIYSNLLVMNSSGLCKFVSILQDRALSTKYSDNSLVSSNYSRIKKRNNIVY